MVRRLDLRHDPQYVEGQLDRSFRVILLGDRVAEQDLKRIAHIVCDEAAM
jgi:hypothetical protein